MLGRFAFFIALSPAFLLASSALAQSASGPVDIDLRQARAEARSAETELRRLEHAAAKAENETAKFAAERQAAAAAISASEARISAANAEARLAQVRVELQSRKLAERQAPLAALLAGIVTMGRRPPLLNSADSSSLTEFVRVRALLDTTLPVIRQRSAALSSELAESRRLQASAMVARRQLAEAVKELEKRQQKFASLEAKAGEQAARLGAGVVGASDVLIASSESAALVRSAGERRRAELRLAGELGVLPAAPARPGKSEPLRPPLQYRLPVAAKVVEGIGSVSDAGIRARGLTLEAYAGQEVLAPANGTIAFAGPFRSHDGVVILSHGGGWMTLMTGVRTNLRKGERVKMGQRLGRALGPLSVELSTNGTPVSAALIAGSSQILSIRDKSG